MRQLFDDKLFDKYNFPEGLSHEFANCTFQHCDFSNKIFDLAELIDCSFIDCNLSMTRFENSVLNHVHFLGCKLMGVDFGKCSKFSFFVSFENCQMNYTVFHTNNLKNTLFQKCSLQEASFIGTNLQSAKFIECDLLHAIFDDTNLEKADFSKAQNYAINPEKNRLKGTKFALPDAIGLLSHLDISIVQ